MTIFIMSQALTLQSIKIGWLIYMVRKIVMGELYLNNCKTCWRGSEQLPCEASKTGRRRGRREKDLRRKLGGGEWKSFRNCCFITPMFSLINFLFLTSQESRGFSSREKIGGRNGMKQLPAPPLCSECNLEQQI